VKPKSKEESQEKGEIGEGRASPDWAKKMAGKKSCEESGQKCSLKVEKNLLRKIRSQVKLWRRLTGKKKQRKDQGAGLMPGSTQDPH